MKIKAAYNKLKTKLKQREAKQKANYGRVGGSQPVKLKKAKSY